MEPLPPLPLPPLPQQPLPLLPPQQQEPLPPLPPPQEQPLPPLPPPQQQEPLPPLPQEPLPPQQQPIPPQDAQRFLLMLVKTHEKYEALRKVVRLNTPSSSGTGNKKNKGRTEEVYMKTTRSSNAISKMEEKEKMKRQEDEKRDLELVELGNHLNTIIQELKEHYQEYVFLVTTPSEAACLVEMKDYKGWKGHTIKVPEDIGTKKKITIRNACKETLTINYIE